MILDLSQLCHKGLMNLFGNRVGLTVGEGGVFSIRLLFCMNFVKSNNQTVRFVNIYSIFYSFWHYYLVDLLRYLEST